jgi:hypothetical protein
MPSFIENLLKMVTPAEAEAKVRTTGPQAEVLRQDIAAQRLDTKTPLTYPYPEDELPSMAARYQAILQAVEDDPRTVTLSTQPKPLVSGDNIIVGQYHPPSQAATIYGVRPGGTDFEQHLNQSSTAHELLHFLLKSPQYQGFVNKKSNLMSGQSSDTPGSLGMTEHDLIDLVLGRPQEGVSGGEMSKTSVNRFFPRKGPQVMKILGSMLGKPLLHGVTINPVPEDVQGLIQAPTPTRPRR